MISDWMRLHIAFDVWLRFGKGINPGPAFSVYERDDIDELLEEYWNAEIRPMLINSIPDKSFYEHMKAKRNGERGFQ